MDSLEHAIQVYQNRRQLYLWEIYKLLERPTRAVMRNVVRALALQSEPAEVEDLVGTLRMVAPDGQAVTMEWYKQVLYHLTRCGIAKREPVKGLRNRGVYVYWLSDLGMELYALDRRDHPDLPQAVPQRVTLPGPPRHLPRRKVRTHAEWLAIDAEVVPRLKRGDRISRIAKDLGVHPQTLYKRYRGRQQNDAPPAAAPTPPYYRSTAEWQAIDVEVRRRLARGQVLGRIARELGVVPGTLHDRYRTHPDYLTDPAPDFEEASSIDADAISVF